MQNIFPNKFNIIFQLYVPSLVTLTNVFHSSIRLKIFIYIKEDMGSNSEEIFEGIELRQQHIWLFLYCWVIFSRILFKGNNLIFIHIITIHYLILLFMDFTQLFMKLTFWADFGHAEHVFYYESFIWSRGLLHASSLCIYELRLWVPFNSCKLNLLASLTHLVDPNQVIGVYHKLNGESWLRGVIRPTGTLNPYDKGS